MRVLIILSLVVLALSSCGVNSSLMFRTKKSDIIRDSIPIAPTEAYRIAPDDKFIFRLYTNDGKRIIDGLTGITEGGSSGSGSSGGNMGMNYWVKPSGYAELPIIGEVQLAGKSVKEAQDHLSLLYSAFYAKPFIQLEVTNQRVIVFPGSPGTAKVIFLVNNNTTLMEALALAGGITSRGQSKKIKIMRQFPDGRKVYEVDLSTLEGLKYADMIVQSNDYIYIEPMRQISRELLQEIGPIVSIISTSVIIITVINAFK
jgi:polysaccharide export outer membrane protein